MFSFGKSALRRLAVRSVQSNACHLRTRRTNHTPSGIIPNRAIHVTRNSYDDNAAARILNDGSAVCVPISDNAESIFHAPWLWLNDPSYIHPSSGQRLRSLGLFPGWKIAHAEIVSHHHQDDGMQQIQLPMPKPPSGCLHPVSSVYNDHHDDDASSSCMLQITWETQNQDECSSSTSYYDMDWLNRCRYDMQALQHRANNTRITPSKAISHQNDQLYTLAYDRLFPDNDTADEDATFEILDAIARQGAAIIQNAPSNSTGPNASVAKVARAMAGWISHGSLYGDLFHVESMPNAHNIAYTTLPLQPHQDLAYYESKPGLQLLHCIQNDWQNGGESVLIDVMAAAEQLRQIAPQHFRTLVESHATFLKQRQGADMIGIRPHIVLGYADEVVAVHWSPPFEGPTIAVPEDKMEDYCNAYAAFERMLNDSLLMEQHPGIPPTLDAKLRSYAKEYTWERRLQPGEMLVFNNQRLLHGRRGLSLPENATDDDRNAVGKRVLAGCYTNIDDTINTYRVLMRKRHGREDVYIPCFGNGSSGSP